MTDYYETLGVEPDASADDLHKAYLRAARQWHPDRFVGQPRSVAEQADVHMRDINEAWSVLGDPRQRSRYDASRTVAASSGQAVRIDPRLVDRDYFREQVRAHEQTLEERNSRLVKAVPFIAFIILLAGLFIFSAYAGRSKPSPPSVTIPGPPVPFAANSCLRVLSEGVVEVPCDGTNDGRLIGVREADGRCPALTRRELAYDTVVLCVS